MKTLDEIKQLMVAGETAEADKALKELLANEPDNLQAKMLYGTCRQLLGDEETFNRIYDELAPVMEELADDPPTAETVTLPETLSLWKKYHTLWEYMIATGLVLTGLTVGAIYFYNTAKEMVELTKPALSLYAGPGYYETKYAGPPRHELEKVDKFMIPEEETAVTK